MPSFPQHEWSALTDSTDERSGDTTDPAADRFPSDRFTSDRFTMDNLPSQGGVPAFTGLSTLAPLPAPMSSSSPSVSAFGPLLSGDSTLPRLTPHLGEEPAQPLPALSEWAPVAATDAYETHNAACAEPAETPLNGLPTVAGYSLPATFELPKFDTPSFDTIPSVDTPAPLAPSPLMPSPLPAGSLAPGLLLPSPLLASPFSGIPSAPSAPSAFAPLPLQALPTLAASTSSAAAGFSVLGDGFDVLGDGFDVLGDGFDVEPGADASPQPLPAFSDPNGHPVDSVDYAKAEPTPTFSAPSGGNPFDDEASGVSTATWNPYPAANLEQSSWSTETFPSETSSAPSAPSAPSYSAGGTDEVPTFSAPPVGLQPTDSPFRLRDEGVFSSNHGASVDHPLAEKPIPNPVKSRFSFGRKNGGTDAPKEKRARSAKPATAVTSGDSYAPDTSDLSDLSEQTEQAVVSGNSAGESPTDGLSSRSDKLRALDKALADKKLKMGRTKSTAGPLGSTADPLGIGTSAAATSVAGAGTGLVNNGGSGAATLKSLFKKKEAEPAAAVLSDPTDDSGAVGDGDDDSRDTARLVRILASVSLIAGLALGGYTIFSSRNPSPSKEIPIVSTSPTADIGTGSSVVSPNAADPADPAADPGAADTPTTSPAPNPTPAPSAVDGGLDFSQGGNFSA
jgi:hypothetical protein